MKKDYGFCGHCGKRIRPFKWALTDWLCAYCYNMKFPECQVNRSDSILFDSRIENEESYQFLKEHLYDKPHLYEKSFQNLKSLVVNLMNFESLKHLISFIQSQNKEIRLRLKSDLITLDKTHRWLRPEIVEILMFILWDDLVKEYGTGERFSESYWDLIQEIKSKV